MAGRVSHIPASEGTCHMASAPYLVISLCFSYCVIGKGRGEWKRKSGEIEWCIRVSLSLWLDNHASLLHVFSGPFPLPFLNLRSGRKSNGRWRQVGRIEVNPLSNCDQRHSFLMDRLVLLEGMARQKRSPSPSCIASYGFFQSPASHCKTIATH